jgi:exosortase/archaeosortase family protein
LCSGSFARLVDHGCRHARYFADQRTPARIAIALSAIPIAILANAARVAGTGLASHWIGPWAARGFFHSFSGWLMFVVAFLALVVVQRVVAAMRPSRGHSVPDAAMAAKC